MIPSILGRPGARCVAAPKNESNLFDEQIQAVAKLVNEFAPANALRRAFGDMVLLTRTGAGYCPIFECKHVNNNTNFAIVHDQVICLHCRHSEQHCSKETTLLLGHLDSSHANSLRRAMSITADINPRCMSCGISTTGLHHKLT